MTKTLLSLLLPLMITLNVCLHADISFQQPRAFGSSLKASRILLADLNNDGAPDIVSVDDVDHTLTVSIGNGHGQFNKLPAIHLNSPFYMAAADFNGDGNVDLAVTETGLGIVSILLGNGDGTFLPSVDYGAGHGCISIGDLNGDGHLDLVVTDTLGLVVLLGNGDATFQHSYLVSAESVLSATVADFDKDGKVDVAFEQSHSISVMFGNGDGTFGSPAVLTSDQNGLGAVVAGDINGDGFPDLATYSAGVYFSTRLLVYLGNAERTFPETATAAIDSELNAIKLGDMNGDGLADIILTNSDGQNSVSVLLGKSNGGLGLPIGTFAGFFPGDAAVADINEDGKLDVAVVDMPNVSNGSISILLGNGNQTFNAPRAYYENTSGAPYFATADFNGDGKPDIAVASYFESFVSVMLDTSAGLAPAARYSTAPSPSVVVAGDVNGDGHVDLAVSADKQVSILLGNGDGTFRQGTPYRIVPGYMVLADFNNDGKLDIFTAVDPRLGLGLGNGDGTFQPLTTIDNVIGVSCLLSADLNGDGNTDVVTCSGDAWVIFFGQGDGTFRVGNVSTRTNVQNGTIADLNRDGIPDLVGTNGGAMTVQLGNGDGTFQYGDEYTPGTDYLEGVTVADFDGDGNPDVAVTGRDYVSVYHGNGDGTLAVPVPTILAQWYSQGIAAADFNGDAKVDLAISGGCCNFQNLVVLLNTSK